MTRAKRGFKARRRRKKLLDLAKGYRGSRKNRYKTAVHVVRRGLVFAFRDRRAKKRDFRRLWIVRINAAARACGVRYSEFINGLTNMNYDIDRSILADLALNNPDAFSDIALKAKKAATRHN
ncbi:MAG: 50S ribosomal protein L20 [Oligoflexales bacterium]|nr:50S ribosomal protein L20 [Oligoflexales bacterium]